MTAKKAKKAFGSQHSMGTSTCARGARRSVGGFSGLAREVREIRRGGKRGGGGSKNPKNVIT